MPWASFWCELALSNCALSVSPLPVPSSRFLAVQGAKGATLRGFETKYHTFMFFDTESIRDGKRRLYILGPDDGRKHALGECESAIAYKMSGNGSLRSW
jgi:hypothetical protein